MNKDDIISVAIILTSLLIAAMMISQTNDSIICGEEKIVLNDSKNDIVFGQVSITKCENTSSGETTIKKVQPAK